MALIFLPFKYFLFVIIPALENILSDKADVYACSRLATMPR